MNWTRLICRLCFILKHTWRFHLCDQKRFIERKKIDILILPLNDRNCTASKNHVATKSGGKKSEGKLNFPLAWSTCKKLTTENSSICHLIWRWLFFCLCWLQTRGLFFFHPELFCRRLRWCLRRRQMCCEWTLVKKVNSNWIAAQFAFNSQLERRAL